MEHIPHAVLSQHFSDRMEGRRLLAALFTTYQFDPGFFEQEILPIFFDVAMGHVPAVRLLQLEDVLRSLPGEIAVYYDANGLVISDAGSSRLAIQRAAIHHKTGVFHPKNVLLLVESLEPDKSGRHQRTLLVAAMSANLTRSGWWENVEVCHVEEIKEGEKTRLRDDLISFLRQLQRSAGASKLAEHKALLKIQDFLKTTKQLQQKSSASQLYPHFYCKQKPLSAFLQDIAGKELHGMSLEVISPFFDDNNHCKPLTDIIAQCKPKEVRIFLPRNASGEVQCNMNIYESISALESVKWGKLPRELLRLGKSEDAGERYVHAKVYRFFSKKPKREVYLVGSVNLTTAAHQNGGNVETGYLIDRFPDKAPDYWLIADESKPAAFMVAKEDDPSKSAGVTHLVLKYHWDTEKAEVFWNHQKVSPKLKLESRGVTLGTIGPLPTKQWGFLDEEMATSIADILSETSFVNVHAEGTNPAVILIQEEGMYQKPSLLMQMSAADILRYWALLTPDQRAAYLEIQAGKLGIPGTGLNPFPHHPLPDMHDTLFDRFAGYFHAFACLERTVREALTPPTKNEKEAVYRLFGKKYDSLGNLLDRVLAGDCVGDDVHHYVIMLCVRQMCDEIQKAFPDFWSANQDGVAKIEERLQHASAIRARLVANNSPGMSAFLSWFDKWFLVRARMEESEAIA